MSDNHPISLFFIHSPFHQLGPVRDFLTSRNYTFSCEFDIRAALDQIVETLPQFVFIALDHPDPMTTSLSKIIKQTLMVQTIPYVNSDLKNEIEKLNQHKEKHKLRPPLAGEAVEKIIQTVLKELGGESNDNISHFQMERPSTETIEQFKTNLQNDYEAEAKLRNLNPRVDYSGYVDISKAARPAGEVTEVNPKLSDDLKTKLAIDFKDNYVGIFHDLLKTAEELAATLSDGTTPITSSTLYSYFQCFIIKSDSWCGYIVVASPVLLDADDLKNPIMAWLRGNLENISGLKEEDLFHIQVEKTDYAEFIKNKVEYSEKIQTQQSEANISFFAAKPSELLLILNDTQEMLEVPVSIIPTETDLPLNLYIHLPENKKYILFTAENKQLALIQKERLESKGVKKLYTQLMFGKQLNQLKAEHHIQNSISTDKKENS